MFFTLWTSGIKLKVSKNVFKRYVVQYITYLICFIFYCTHYKNCRINFTEPEDFWHQSVNYKTSVYS